MSRKSRVSQLVLFSMIIALALVLSSTARVAAEPPSPSAVFSKAFTYQGLLRQAGNPANGHFDFQFLLYDAAVGGSQQGTIVTKTNVAVVNGLFTVVLDFGSIFSGSVLYLDIAVRPASGGSYTPLAPRQALNATPMANSLSLPANLVSASSGTLFRIENTGSGEAAEFKSASSFATLYISNNGQGAGIQIDTSNNNAITGYNIGPDGYAAQVELMNASNPWGALLVRTSGTGEAIDAEVNTNTNADALYARTTSSSASSYAGIFVGNVEIFGNLSKSSGSFRIDHPLDPANKYLNHSFVESPDMKNIYDGVATLDANGEAVVVFPDWFAPLNQDFRYQLTAIGAPGPNLYIAEKIQTNRFKIAGGTPGMEVSWQVTGIRHDPYANNHRIQVEENKPPEEQGSYIYPQGYNQPEEKGLDRVQHPLIQPTPTNLYEKEQPR